MATQAYSAIAAESQQSVLVMQTTVAIVIAGAAVIAATAMSPVDSRFQSAMNFCVNPTQDIVRRCVNRILVAGTLPAVPTDAQVQAAVNLLIPPTGSFVL